MQLSASVSMLIFVVCHLEIKWLCCFAWYIVSVFLVELTLTRRISECKGCIFSEKFYTFWLYSQHSFFLLHTHMHIYIYIYTMSVIVTLTEACTMREKIGIAVHSRLKSSCQIIFCHLSTDTLHFFRCLQVLKTSWDKVLCHRVYKFRLWYF
jgi:hypothetical protein